MIGEGGYDEAGEESSILLQDDRLKNGGKDSDLCNTSSQSSPALNLSGESINSHQGNTLQNQFAFIKDGICATCYDAEAKQTSLECLLCKSLFHAVCRDVDKDRKNADIICPRTFYNAFTARQSDTGVNSARFGTFAFVCNVCKTRLENGNAATAVSKVDIIDKRVNSLTQSMENMKSLLMQVVNTKSCPEKSEKPPQQTAPPEIVPKPLYRSVLIMSSTKADQQHENCQHVDRIIKENAIHADKRYVNKKGEIVVVCPTTTDRENLAAKVSQELPEIKTHQPPERLPTISVANLTENYSEEALEDLILLAHPNIKSLKTQGETFSVLKVKPQIKNKVKYQATIRVSNNIRKIIESQGDRLYICSFSCRVYDQFHVKRCNKCHGFGHYRSECQSQKSVCGYCSLNHASEDCELKKRDGFMPCCTNCSKSKFDDQKNTHTAFDRTCPSYAAEQHQLRKTINYYNSKNL